MCFFVYFSVFLNTIIVSRARNGERGSRRGRMVSGVVGGGRDEGHTEFGRCSAPKKTGIVLTGGTRCVIKLLSPFKMDNL